MIEIKAPIREIDRIDEEFRTYNIMSALGVNLNKLYDELRKAKITGELVKIENIEGKVIDINSQSKVLKSKEIGWQRPPDQTIITEIEVKILEE